MGFIFVEIQNEKKSECTLNINTIMKPIVRNCLWME